MESGRKGATIRYKLMSEDEILKIGKYSKMRIWLTDDKVDTVLLILGAGENNGGEVQSVKTEGIAEESGMSGSKPEEEGSEPEESRAKHETKEIWGNITEFTDDGFVINMGTTEDLGNGASIATIGVGDKMNLVTVSLLPDTVYQSKTIYDTLGERMEEGAASREDLRLEQHVTMEGYIENGEFIADKIVISIFAFNN